MFKHIYMTDWGEVRISEREAAVCKAALEIRCQWWMDKTETFARRIFALEQSIHDACNRFAKHKYGGDNGRA